MLRLATGFNTLKWIPICSVPPVIFMEAISKTYVFIDICINLKNYFIFKHFKPFKYIFEGCFNSHSSEFAPYLN